MCRREAVHHRRCGHVIIHSKRCPAVLRCENPKTWCVKPRQRETIDRCKKCRRAVEVRANEKEEARDRRIAEQDARCKRDEERGVRVPGGIMEWHPKKRGFFGRIGDLFRGVGKKGEYREEEESDDDDIPTKPVRQRDGDDEIVSTMMEGMHPFDDGFDFGSSSRVKGPKKRSPRDSQTGSEQ